MFLSREHLSCVRERGRSYFAKKSRSARAEAAASHAIAASYFNADGNIDLLWRNRVTGDNAIWFMNGVTQSGFTDIQAQPNLDWQIVGTGDFNNDGQTDILWRHAKTGENAVWYMNGGTYLSTAAIQTVADSAYVSF